MKDENKSIQLPQNNEKAFANGNSGEKTESESLAKSQTTPLSNPSKSQGSSSQAEEHSSTALVKVPDEPFQYHQFPEETIPKEFFKPVIAYHQTMTDAPLPFLFSGVLMTCAGVIGNRVKILLGSAVIKPNLYIMTMSGSTVNRKSAGVSLTKKKLQELEKTVGKRFLMAESGSLEGLVETMREARSGEQKEVMNTGIVCFSELSSFIDNIRKDYNAGYESFILDVYDGNGHRRELKKEQSVIKDPCLSIIGAITMAQFNMKLSETDAHSGLLQRFIIVYEPERTSKIKSLVEIETADPETEELILKDLVEIDRTAEAIHQSGKTFQLSEDAEAIYQESFDADQKLLSKLASENAELAGMMSSFHGRLDVMKIKIALIYQTVKIAQSEEIDGEYDLLISGETMLQAIVAIHYYFSSLYNMLRAEYANTRYAKQLQKLEKILRRNGGRMSRSKLLRNSHWKAEEFNSVFKTACEAGQMVEYEEKQASGQKAKMVRSLLQ